MRRLVLDDGRIQRDLVIRERMTVGRDPSCDISDSDPRLSRRHAEFLATSQGLLIRDLQSRNGIRVNGRSAREATLAPGDLVEIAHLAIRFLDDEAVDPAGVGLSTTTPTPVGSIKVREGFEDDRTRARTPQLSSAVSGPIEMSREVRAPRDAGDVAISAVEGTVRVALPPSLRQPLPPRLGVTDLMKSSWGIRVLGHGLLLSVTVFAMVTIPMWHWLTAIAGPIGPGPLVRTLAVPLLASLFVGLVVASLIARTTSKGLGRR